MIKLLITGASGFLGGHLIQQAAEKYATVGLYSTYPISLKNITSAAFDLSKPWSLNPILDRFKPNTIIHNAALADPDRCEKNAALAHRINVIATEKIAEWCYLKNVRLIYISTDMVFDGEKGNYSETDSPNPVSIYAQSKATADQRAITLNPNTAVCRIALMYGRGGFRRDYSSEWMERELMRRAAQPDLAPLGLFSDQFRSLIGVGNVARAILELVESDFCGILHIGGPDPISRYDFGKKLCRTLNLPLSLIKPIKQDENQLQARRPRDVSLNISLARSLLKTPLLSVKTGLLKAFS